MRSIDILEPGDLDPILAAIRTAADRIAALEDNLTQLADRVATLEQPAPEQPSRSPLEVGVQYTATWPGVDDVARKAMCAGAKAAGAGWVRLDVAWASFQPSNATTYDEGAADRVLGHIELARAEGLKVLLEVYWAPQWATGSTNKAAAPKDPASFGTFMRWLAARYKGKVAAYEVWNEQNNTRFLSPATAAAYVPLLKAAYAGVKSSDPSALVVVGGCEYVDTTYLKSLYTAGARGHYDVMACHPYPGVANLAPDGVTAYDKWNPMFLAEWVKVMGDNGDTTPVWLTECGWSTHPNTGNEPNWARGVTEAEQAEYTYRMVQLVRERFPQVSGVFFYTIRDTHETDVQQASYGLMRRDNTHKPAIPALRRAVTDHG